MPRRRNRCQRVPSRVRLFWYPPWYPGRGQGRGRLGGRGPPPRGPTDARGGAQRARPAGDRRSSESARSRAGGTGSARPVLGPAGIDQRGRRACPDGGTDGYDRTTAPPWAHDPRIPFQPGLGTCRIRVRVSVGRPRRHEEGTTPGEIRRMDQRWECLDGNEAARPGRLQGERGHLDLSRSRRPSPMAEHADDWAACGQAETCGARSRTWSKCSPRAGAAGAMHGALQKGALATTFTASQGPPAHDPEHVQDRRRADPRGHPRRGSNSRNPRAVDLRRPQRRDACPGDGLGDAGPLARSRKPTTFALVSHAATLRSRVPFLHFFDGFRDIPRKSTRSWS